MQRRIISLLIAITMFMSVGIRPALATEYQTQWVGYTCWHGTHTATIRILYTPTINALYNIKIEKGLNGYHALYTTALKNPNSEWITDLGLGENQLLFITSVTGLVPDTKYTINLAAYMVSHAGGSCSCDNNPSHTYELYTDPCIPTNINFPTIGIDTAVIRWDNGTNPVSTIYTLQRKKAGDPTWTNLTTQANFNEYTDAGLNPDTTYYYRIVVNAKSGRLYYSQEHTVTTAVDPNLAASIAAKSASEAAAASSAQAKASADAAALQSEIAAISSLLAQQDTNYIRNTLLSVDGGIVQDASGTVIQAVRNLDVKVNNITNRLAPTITSVQGQSGATCTTGTEYAVVVSTTPSTGVDLSAVCSGPSPASVVVNGNIINFIILMSGGVYTATITAATGSVSTQ